ncbi:MAG: hypothetical protein AVDCRST_MAG50-1270 [uncultured Acidimicrobiales bacterium]|uniref:Uncharacterized protein n=1 Tax=uncultured Acidimicrobiales bacterium TaxID=310071 RepID=A0A6J4HTE6_9ACTN|nr:MAG: hypothetical protein AVDCRST_MAG50-1270 [uncultured Acidimicrobiales bacterium]
MATEHLMYLAAPGPAEEVAATVLRDGQEGGLIASEVTVASVMGEGINLGSGLRVRISHVQPDPKDPVVADMQIVPNTLFYFRLHNLEDRERQTDEVVWLALDALIRFPGDAVLTFQLEVIWLLRRGDQLWLHTEPNFWTPERLQMVPMPYLQAAMHFPD